MTETKPFLLCVCIPTVVGREAQFEALFNKIGNQVRDLGLTKEIDCIVFKDNKEISIGLKRDKMYKLSKAYFTVQIDDDDDVPDDYIKTVYDTLIANPDVDCLGYIERVVMDGVTKYSKISKEFADWADPSNDARFNYYRTPFFKVPIKTSICQQVGVSDMRFGEDHDFARRIKPHLKTEVFIDKAMYYYTGTSLTAEQHKERYGIGG